MACRLSLSLWIWQIQSYFSVSWFKVFSSWSWLVLVLLVIRKPVLSQEILQVLLRSLARLLQDRRACLPSQCRDFQVQICHSKLCLTCSTPKIYQVLADGCHSNHHCRYAVKNQHVKHRCSYGTGIVSRIEVLNKGTPWVEFQAWTSTAHQQQDQKETLDSTSCTFSAKLKEENS